MRAIEFVVLLISISGAFVQGREDFECPSAGGAFPHPQLCDYFYRCIENVPTLEQCPSDQLFDLTYDGCNHAFLVDCGDRIPPTPTPTEAPGEGEFDCPTPGGAFPHPESCELYYLCVENVGRLEECPNRQLFDLEYDGCNHAELVDCGDRVRPTNAPPGPGTTAAPGEGEFDCPAPGGAFPHPELCDFYYLCANNVGTLKECQDDHLFDLTYHGCNHPEMVDCGDRVRPTDVPSGPGTTSAPGEGDFECPVSDGLFPNPEDCASYYNCANFFPVLQNCTPSLYFNVDALVCDFPANVDCGDRPEPTN